LRILLCLMLAFAGLSTEAQAEKVKDKSFIAYVTQTRSVKASCFPASLRSILADIRKQFGHSVIVTSGARGAGRARRGSLHRSCKAADIRVPGASAAAVAKFARGHALVGGVGTYCGSRAGLIHVDVGPRRSWTHCGGRRKKRG
jgi:uncharacterized protein YcbK (DUF882 family)